MQYKINKEMNKKHQALLFRGDSLLEESKQAFLKVKVESEQKVVKAEPVDDNKEALHPQKQKTKKRKTDRQTDRQTQTGRQTDRQTDRQTVIKK